MSLSKKHEILQKCDIIQKLKSASIDDDEYLDLFYDAKLIMDTEDIKKSVKMNSNEFLENEIENAIRI